jgi:hypothetical protein
MSTETSTQSSVWKPQEMKGKLMISKVKSKETSPDYFGSASIDGKMYKMAGWKNVSKAGNNVLDIKFELEERPSDTPEVTSTDTDF